MNVIIPIGDNQRRKAEQLIAALEGRKATKVAYTPHPQGAAAPSPASDFPDLGPGQNVAPGEVFINWARIDGPEELKAAIQQMADARAGDID